MDLTDLEDALWGKKESIRRGGITKMSRSRLRIRRNILDPIYWIVSNNGGGNRKNVKLKKVVSDIASNCSYVTDLLKITLCLSIHVSKTFFFDR